MHSNNESWSPVTHNYELSLFGRIKNWGLGELDSFGHNFFSMTAMKTKGTRSSWSADVEQLSLFVIVIHPGVSKTGLSVNLKKNNYNIIQLLLYFYNLYKRFNKNFEKIFPYWFFIHSNYESPFAFPRHGNPFIFVSIALILNKLWCKEFTRPSPQTALNEFWYTQITKVVQRSVRIATLLFLSR